MSKDLKKEEGGWQRNSKLFFVSRVVSKEKVVGDKVREVRADFLEPKKTMEVLS